MITLLNQLPPQDTFSLHFFNHNYMRYDLPVKINSSYDDMGAYPANDLFINLAIDVVSNPLQNINDNDSKSDIVKSVNSVLEYVHTLRERLPVNALIILLSAADVHDGPQAAKDQIEMKYEHLFPGYKPVSIFSMALSASAQGTSLLKAISSDVIRIDS